MIDGLPTGKVRVGAVAGEGTAAWYDGATSLAAATPVPVSPNRTASVAITLP